MTNTEESPHPIGASLPRVNTAVPRMALKMNQKKKERERILTGLCIQRHRNSQEPIKITVENIETDLP